MTGNESGRVSVFLAIALTGLLAIIGVTVDAAGQLRTLLHADNLAAEAARAAGQAVDTGQVRRGDELAVVHAQAVDYAARYLAAAGRDLPGGDWSVRPGATPGTVEIEVRLTYRTVILRLFGIPEREVTANATAVLVTDPA